MTDSTMHLSDWTLEQLAEEMLHGEELAGATAHVEECGRCAAELEGYRALFAALGSVPRFAPSPSFSEGVMARVRVGPAPSPAWSLLQRWVPGTRRGWVFLGTAVATPAVSMVAVVLWLMSHPMVAPAGLFNWARGGLTEAVEAGVGQLFRWGMQSGLFGAGQLVMEAVRSLPLGTVALVLAVLAVAIPLSAWSLIRLVRTPMGNVNYAN